MLPFQALRRSAIPVASTAHWELEFFVDFCRNIFTARALTPLQLSFSMCFWEKVVCLAAHDVLGIKSRGFDVRLKRLSQ